MPQFKAVEVNNEEQFVHVSRYIHLNPYSSGLITDLGELLASSLTSLPNYLNRAEELGETNYLLGMFANNKDKYRDFVLDQADYQKKLEIIKKSRAL